MKKIKVVEILGKPRETYMNMGDFDIEYWSVPVVMEHEGFTYESAVTYNTYKDAVDLKVGKIFYR